MLLKKPLDLNSLSAPKLNSRFTENIRSSNLSLCLRSHFEHTKTEHQQRDYKTSGHHRDAAATTNGQQCKHFQGDARSDVRHFQTNRQQESVASWHRTAVRV